MNNFKCEGGIAYETKDTRQNALRGLKRGGEEIILSFGNVKQQMRLHIKY